MTEAIILTTPDRISFANHPVRYPAVERCIYCGETQGKLGDEHIVPYGLARNSLVLPASSCRACETVTGRIEQAVLRRTLGHIRVRFGAPSRNKKHRNDQLTLHRVKFETMEPGSSGATIEGLDIPSSAAPMFFISLLLDQPGILRNLALGTPLPWNMFYTYRQNEAGALLKPGEGLRVAEINPYIYAQFLAKMAYAYSVAVYGYGSFQPLVLDLIFGRTNYFRHWVGGEPVAPPSIEDEVHHISCSTRIIDGRSYVVVRMRLFSFLGAPVFDIVAGELGQRQPGLAIRRLR
jgi:hypothetical protein